MCRTGLTEEQNIKKPRGQALINFIKLSQNISKTCPGYPSFSSFAFIFFFPIAFLPLLPTRLTLRNPAPFPWSGEGQIAAFAKPWVTASWHSDTLPWASGPVPSETARFMSGLHVQQWLKSARLKCCTQSSDSLSRNTLLSAIPLD